MLKHIELDPTCALSEQFADTSDDTTILINIFDVDPSVEHQFKDAWLIDADFFAKQPGYISAQLHQGIEGSRIFVNYAVFENTAAFAATNTQPQFVPLRAIYPDEATAHPHLFRRVHVPGICVGELTGTGTGETGEQPHGLHHVELDPTCSLEQQYADTTGRTTVLLNLFDVAPEDHDYFVAAWKRDAEFFKAQPGYISAQLHKSIGDSRLFLNYAVFEDTASFAATNQQPEFGPLRKIYPDSATAHPHLLRRLSIPGICVGEGNRRHDGTVADDAMTSEREFNEHNIEEFRRNGGKVGGQFEGFPLLLLTSKGAKTGVERVNPVAYFDIDHKIYVVGSAAGRDGNPGWVFNLRADPLVSVEIGAEPPTQVTAHELPRDGRDAIFAVVVERAPGFADYEERTDRVIPIFELTPDM